MQARRIVAILVAGLLVAGCGIDFDLGSAEPGQPSQDSATQTEPDTPKSGENEARPTEGECRGYDYEQMLPATETTEAVPCDEDPTAVIFEVKDLPEKLDYASNRDKVEAWIGDECREGFAGAVGTEQVLVTNFRLAFFTPTDDQIADGARWYRCDIAYGLETGSDNQTLEPLPGGGSLPLLDSDDVPDELKRCYRSQENGLAEPVFCDEAHDVQADFAAELDPQGRSWPGREQAHQFALDVCRDELGQDSGASYPTQQMWTDESTQSYIICYEGSLDSDDGSTRNVRWPA